MNTKHLIAALIAVAPLTAALADEYYEGADRALQITSSVSRADVAAEAKGPRSELVGEDSGSAVIASGFQSTTTRAQVTAEYIANRDESRALVGEDSGAEYVARHHAVSRTLFANK
jgi:hypothetical protein